MHATSIAQLERFKTKYLSTDQDLEILEIGAFDESGAYRNVLAQPKWHHTGADMRHGPGVSILLTKPYEWVELPWNHYDLVISGQTLEHVEKPWKWITAVARTMKPGALLWVCAPNTWEFHAVPKDCWRVWPDGMRALFHEADLLDVECYAEGPDTVGIARKP